MRRVLAVAAALSLVALAPVGPARAQDPDPRIVGGAPGSLDIVPWQVNLLIHRSQGNFLCGGVRVGERWVLTAAHCVAGVSAGAVEVGMGKTALSSQTAADYHGVRKVTVHPGFHMTSAGIPRNDVAVVELSQAPTTGTPIRLWNDESGPGVGTRARISGWGRTTYPTGTPSNWLQVAAVYVLAGPGERCGRYGPSFVSAEMVCAGKERGGTSVCHGDSGGPLASKADGRWRLVGLTSWGWGCAVVDFPGVFTRVSTYGRWIREQMIDTTLSRPTAPTDLVASRPSDEVILAWGLPRANGGGAVEDYVIDMRIKGDLQWTRFDDPVTRTTRAKVTGLEPGTKYVFRVAAKNRSYRGDWSPRIWVTTPSS